MDKHGYIEKIKISGFKKFKNYEIKFHKGINILIGENEAGKSTILEAINVVLNQKYNNFDKYIIEELLNRDNVNNFANTKKYEDLPKIAIEIFLHLPNIPQNADFFGFYHSDNPKLKTEVEYFKYGIIFECVFDEDFRQSLEESIANGKVPYDFYKMTWKTFADVPLKVQKKPIRILNIDNSSSNTLSAFDFYNKSLYLNSYDDNLIFQHKGIFREKVKEAFNSLELKDVADNKKFGLNQKKLIIENLLTIYENDISIDNMGKGKENIIKTETALAKDNNKSDIILIEEPESHLSHTNLRKMIYMINDSTNEKQMIITTHNNLIVKQTDIKNLIIIGQDSPKCVNEDISESCKYFFEKSDDYNLLQFLLCNKCILVEGRTEYQLINYKYSQLANEENANIEKDNIDVISCYGKSYKNYLEIANGLGKKICVITDNDKKQDFIDEIKKENATNNYIKIFTDDDIANWTFEVGLYKLNKEKLENMIHVQKDAEYKFNGESYKDKQALGYMLNHKADVAYDLFGKNHEYELEYPQYIKDAIKWIRS